MNTNYILHDFTIPETEVSERCTNKNRRVHKLRKSAIWTMLLFVLLLLGTTPESYGQSFSATLSSNQLFKRPNPGSSNCGGTYGTFTSVSSNSNTDYGYATQSFTVTTAGNYTIKVTSSTAGDPMLLVYSSFNPSNPTSGFKVGDDDSNGNLLPKIGTCDNYFSAGTYTIVVTSYSSSTRSGTVNFNISGAGTTTVLPTVTTNSASSITSTGATLGGNITADGGASITARGIAYGTSSNPTSGVSSGSGTGAFSQSISGLTPGTRYYARAYATNSVGTAYGPQIEFTTQSYIPPTVLTGNTTSIGKTSATFNGNVIDTGGQSVTRGFQYSTNSSFSEATTRTLSGTQGTGNFSYNETNLSGSTRYYVRAWAENTGGRTYGSSTSYVTDHTINYNTGSNGSLTGTTTQTIADGGTTSNVSAIPDAGYHFLQWSDYNTSNPRTDENVTSSFTRTANFSINLFRFTEQPANRVAGVANTFKIDAVDNNGNVMTNSDRDITVEVYTSDNTLVNAKTMTGTLINGTITIESLNLTKTGNYYLKVKDNGTANSIMADANSSSFTITPAAIHHFTLAGITDPHKAGETTSPTVIAYDEYDNVKYDYTGTVTFSTDNASVNLAKPTVLPNDYTFTLADQGIKTFTNEVNFKQYGDSFYLKVNDISVTSVEGQQDNISVTSAGLNYYAISVISNYAPHPETNNILAGADFSVLAELYDEFDNKKLDFSGDLDITFQTNASPSPLGNIIVTPLPGLQTFTNGESTISGFTFYNAQETPTITIVETLTGSHGTTEVITVWPNDLDNFLVKEEPVQNNSIGGVRVTAGDNFSVKVTARDQYNNVKRDYEGNIQFKSSNDLIVEYPNELQQFTLADNGVRILTDVISIPTTGIYWLRAADSPRAYKTGDLTNIIVGPGAYSTSVSEFTATSATTGLTAGDYVNVLITPRDAEGNLLCDCQNVAIKLNGETYDWDSDPNPISVTDNHDGTYTAAIRITQLGTNTLTASVDGSDISTEIEVVVDYPATPSYLAITGTETQVAGTSQDITLTAYDEFQNKATNYTGTKQIRFGGASVTNAPITAPTVESTSFDNNTPIDFADGEATVAMTLYKVESAKVTAADWTSGAEEITTPNDIVDGDITYVYQLPVEVTPAPADYLAISGSGTQEAGTTQDIIITAYDEFNNVATSYSGTKQIRFAGANPSDAPDAINPTVEVIDFGSNTEMDFANGAATVSMALYKAESAKITAADWTSGSEGIISPDDVVNGETTYVYQLPVVVNATSPSYFAITGSGTQTAGVAQNITITMFDQYNNIASSYDGDMNLTFSGANASFDGNNPEISTTEFGTSTTVTFSNGVAENVSMTLFDAAHETQDALVNVSNGSQTATGLELAVNVIPNSATKLRIDTEPSGYVRAGDELAQQPVISIRDAYGNLVNDNTTSVTATANGTESLVGTTEITAVNGIVSFNDLSYQKMETITIDFAAAPELTTVTSGSTIVDHNATAKFAYSVTPPYIYAGGQRGAYTVERYDAYGNLVNNVVNTDGSDGNGDETVYLYSDNIDVNTKFYGAATGGTALSAVAISNGATSANFWYYTEKEGDHLITASEKPSLDTPDTDTENATNILEVKPAALSHFVVSGVGTDAGEGWTQHYYGDSQTVTVEAIDIFGNRKINYTGTVTFSLTDAEANEPGDAGTNYPLDYTFTLADGGIHTFENAILFERPSFEHPSYPVTNEWWVTVVDMAQPSKYGSQVKIKVQKRPIIITANKQTKKYYGDTYDLGCTEFTVTSGITAYENPDVFAGNEGISDVTLTSAGTEASALTGDYPIIPGNVIGINGFNEDYYDITFVNDTLTVDPRPITITVAANQSKTYGDIDPSVYNYTLTEGSLASGDAFSGNLTREAGEDVGDYEVYQTGLTIKEGATDKTNNYNITLDIANKFEITKLAVAINADAKNKTYGDIDPALTFVSAPAVGTTLANGEVIAFNGELNREAGENVGDYAIRQNTLNNTNFDITYTAADLTIEQLAVAVNADAKNKTYGDIDPALTFVSAPAVGTTLANGEVIAFNGELNREAGENVGDYAIRQNTLNNTNFDITYTAADLTIEQLAVAVNADAKNKTYGDIDPALTFVSAPAVGTTLANGEVITFNGELNRVEGENVGDYAIRQNTLDNTNFDITYTAADLTIGQLAVAVNANAKNKTYGDIDPALTFVSAPAVGTTLANGEVIAFNGELNREAGENVGDYAIRQNTLDNANFDITYTAADLTIGQLAVAVNADAKNKTYGDIDPALTFVSAPAVGTTLANGEVITFSGELSRVEGENVGDYAIKQNTLDNANFDITYTAADLTIGQLAVAVNADAKNKTYGDIDPALTFVSAPAVGTTLANGEVIAFNGELNRVAGENVGDYAIRQNTLDNANFDITYTAADLTIGQLAVAVNADAKNKTYGDIDPALTFVSAPAVGTTLANGEVITFSGELSRVEGENVGDYAIKQNTLDNANFDITYTAADLTIGQLAVAVNADAKNKTYGDIDPALTFVSAPAVGTALANGEVIAFNGELNREAGENVGDYAIKQNTLDNANFDITYTAADLTIGQLAVAINADAKNKTYGDIDPALTFVSAPAVGTTLANGEVIAFNGELNRVAGENVGDYAIKQNTLDNANFDISYTAADLTIEQLAVAVNADAKNKTYGDIDPALTFVSAPAVGTTLANGEVIAFNGELNRVAGENVGDYAIRQNTLDNVNFDITYTAADLTIEQLAVAVNADAKNKTYGDIDPDLTFVSAPAVGTTLANGEVIAFNGELNRVEGENVGDYAIRQNTLDNANFDITYTAADLTIEQLAVAVNADAKNKIYGDIDPALTFVSAPAVGTALANGEVIAFSGELNRAEGEDAGSYEIKPGTLSNSNYNIAFVSDIFEITTKALTIAADDKTKEYDGEVFNPFTVSYEGFAGSEDESVLEGTLTFSGSAANAVSTGTDYVITPEGLTSTNYAITFVDGVLDITKKALTITADDKSKIYDGEVYSPFTVSYEGFAGSDDESVLEGTLTFSGSAANAIDPGTDYVITPEGLTSTNYAITFVNGSLTIIPRIAGDTNEDGVISDGEIAGDTNGDGIINDNEVAGDIDGDGVIGNEEVAGDTNGDGIIDPSEIAGDTNGNGVIDQNEVAGDTNGDGQITDDETAGDTDGDGQISENEVAGDVDGNGNIDEDEIAGDTNGDGSIDEAEIAGDTDGDGSISEDEIVGDKNGDGQISDPEIAGDTNGDGIIGTGEVRLLNPDKDHLNIMKLFTPNNDGFNDFWKIDNLVELGRVRVKIYDRWGKLIYESSAYQNDWDGTSKGKPVAEGGYIYHVKTERAGTMSGVVNLVR